MHRLDLADFLVLAEAAILCSRVLRNHPLPDGNKRVAYLCMIELVRRNGATWRPAASERERVETIERLAARQLDEADFVTWLAAQVGNVPEPT
jgi:death-on-curing protein